MLELLLPPTPPTVNMDPRCSYHHHHHHHRHHYHQHHHHHHNHFQPHHHHFPLITVKILTTQTLSKQGVIVAANIIVSTKRNHFHVYLNCLNCGLAIILALGWSRPQWWLKYILEQWWSPPDFAVALVWHFRRLFMWFPPDNKEYFPLIRTSISPWWQRVFLFITALGGNVEAPWGPRCTMCCVLSTHLETYDTKCNGSLEDGSSAQKYFINVWFSQQNIRTIVGYLQKHFGFEQFQLLENRILNLGWLPHWWSHI